MKGSPCGAGLKWSYMQIGGWDSVSSNGHNGMEVPMFHSTGGIGNAVSSSRVVGDTLVSFPVCAATQNSE